VPEHRGLTWRRLYWQRPVDPTRIAGGLRHWAADQRSPHVVLETRMSSTETQYLIGAASISFESVMTPLRGMPNVTARPLVGDRAPVVTSGHLTASTRHRPLRLNDPEAIIRAILAVSIRLKKGEELVVQTLLGPRRIPQAVPNASPSSVVRPWWSVAWMGDGGQIDGEKRSALRTKVSDHGFACTIRLGVIASTPDRRQALLIGLVAALRVSEAPGVRLRLRRDRPAHLNQANAPWLWPLRLGVPELVGLTAWPLGDGDLPGQPPAHPKLLPPAPGTTGDARVIADVALPSADKALSLTTAHALHHLHVVGPTGTGKSTLLASLIIQDIEDGRGVILIEPKGDLVDDVLARVPDKRRDDIVILDPNDEAPVGLNPLARGDRRPELVADHLLAVFRQLYGKNIGPRSADILYAGLLTLAMRPDASIVMLPLLLTNPGIRRSLTAGIRDPLTLEPFWATFEHWSDAERATAVAPVMNKLRPLLRPGLRAVLGQRQPRFHLGQVFTENKVLLVPLRRGVIGPEASSLLGSLVVADLWQTIQARSSVDGRKREPVMVYIDEVQDYLHLPTDIGEALAQARGYGVGFTLAHQFLGQLPRDMRSAILANARSRVAFQLAHDDATVLARGHDELAAADFEALGQYEIYASLFANGRVSPYASGKSRALIQRRGSTAPLRAASRARYGRPLDEIEAGFTALLDVPAEDLGPTGRRRRSQP
jgi:hypothetical protein